MVLVQNKEKAKNEKGQPAVKAAQLEMLRVVCQRMCDELAEGADEHRRSDPLMWLLHGLPGTGKSEVLMMVKELFQEVCGWQMGFEYQMVALQAVMAQLLGGDTIHHASGMKTGVFMKGVRCSGNAVQCCVCVIPRPPELSDPRSISSAGHISGFALCAAVTFFVFVHNSDFTFLSLSV